MHIYIYIYTSLSLSIYQCIYVYIYIYIYIYTHTISDRCARPCGTDSGRAPCSSGAPARPVDIF